MLSSHIRPRREHNMKSNDGHLSPPPTPQGIVGPSSFNRHTAASNGCAD